ncbi:7-cyano-7-deazaguanine synthase [Thermocrinis minervae]|uniref:7-cyano-7-deazaguanine synthase n=1 Tax=Thermocrinis minervae TaxID=381751 RepID=A0A1M6Q6A9_9AQUI|nr:7-cyano-7-deazaguanine synthase [Thermocrinis minervae]SHK15752.1 7-cyano-7-deazaguanine synthase [Thermocrinis minervae]
MNVDKVGVLFSGGVESTTLLYMYLRKGFLVYPFYVKSGMLWENLELENAANLWVYTKRLYRNLMAIKIVPYKQSNFLKVPTSEEELFIPARNLSIIVAVAPFLRMKGIKTLAIGSLGAYPFPDNSLDYLKKVQELLSIGMAFSVNIEAPLFGMDKRYIVKSYKDIVPYYLTLSCANPRRIKGKITPCGRCIKCLERFQAFD